MHICVCAPCVVLVHIHVFACIDVCAFDVIAGDRLTIHCGLLFDCID